MPAIKNTNSQKLIEISKGDIKILTKELRKLRKESIINKSNNFIERYPRCTLTPVLRVKCSDCLHHEGSCNSNTCLSNPSCWWNAIDGDQVCHDLCATKNSDGYCYEFEQKPPKVSWWKKIFGKEIK